MLRVGAGCALCVALANCAASDKFARRIDPKYGVMASPRVVEPGQPVPKGGGVYRVGKPYLVAGRLYVPQEYTSYKEEGIASWYGDDFHGRLTANGEVFDKDAITAAHPTLPIPSYVRVTNLRNRRSLIVRVNDRGPYHSNRLIDVSGKAAELLGFHDNGVARVQVEYVGRAPLEGSDDRMLVATLREGAPAPPPSAIRVASAKPFVPRLHGSSGVHGDIPLPPDRPFDLGEDAVASADAAPSGFDSHERRARTAQLSAAPESPARMTSPVSAFASGRQDASATMMPAVMSGRGLY
ncbi:MAG TPA: septal ring lytic transglycosylase RlpA family protein [Xanthobacteraceae bacterium]|nr:septal ring lytic transglycosylase RlpA family protein [Xanthobacteraceae bacterium]